MKSVLIVGGTGVISSAVVDEAVNAGFDVTCINRGHNHGVSLNPNVEALHFDVRDRKIAEEALSGRMFDVVVDFICYTATQVSYSLELFSDKCKQYVFISTDSVYKIQEDGHYDENTPCSNPEWAYSYQKAECESIVKEYCCKKNLAYTIVRPSITYGNTRIPYGFMPAYGYHYSLIDRIKAGKAVICWNEGQNLQTIMRVEDFAQGMVGLWCNEKALNEAFGICGEVVSWNDVLNAIEKVIGVEIKRINIPVDIIINKLPSRRGEFLVDRAKNHSVSNLKLRSAVPSFSIKYPLIEGVKKTVSYYEENKKLHGIDYVYDGQCDMLIKSVTNRTPRFVRYDENASMVDYYLGLHSDSFLVRAFNSISKYTKLVGNKVKKTLNFK